MARTPVGSLSPRMTRGTGPGANMLVVFDNSDLTDEELAFSYLHLILGLLRSPPPVDHDGFGFARAVVEAKAALFCRKR